MSEEALQIAEKRSGAKDKREKQQCIHLNEEFQRITRREKKDFLSDQCEEIEENIRMGGGGTRDLLKKTRDIKGKLCAKIDTIKDGNGKYLIEAEDCKMSWQEYTKELNKKRS